MRARMAPLIIAERRINLFLRNLIGGIVWLPQLDQIGAFGMPTLHINSTVLCANLNLVISLVVLWALERPGVFLVIVMF